MAQNIEDTTELGALTAPTKSGKKKASNAEVNERFRADKGISMAEYIAQASRRYTSSTARGWKKGCSLMAAIAQWSIWLRVYCSNMIHQVSLVKDAFEGITNFVHGDQSTAAFGELFSNCLCDLFSLARYFRGGRLSRVLGPRCAGRRGQ